MPRYPTSAGLSMPQIGLEEARQGEDRKARKAASRQALLGSILGTGTNLLNTGAGIYGDIARNRTQRDLTAQREAGDTARLATQIGAQKEIAGLDRAAAFPNIETPMGPGEQGPPVSEPYNTFQARTDRMQAETDAKRGPLDEQLAKLMMAARGGAASRVGEMPFLSPEQRERGEVGELTGRKDPEVEKLAAIQALLSQQGFEGGMLPPQMEQRTKEELARRFGVAATNFQDPFTLKLYADRIAAALPGGLPTSEPEGMERFAAEPSPVDFLLSKFRGGLNAKEQRLSRNEILDLMQRVRSGPGVTPLPEFGPTTRQYISGRR